MHQVPYYYVYVTRTNRKNPNYIEMLKFIAHFQYPLPVQTIVRSVSPFLMAFSIKYRIFGKRKFFHTNEIRTTLFAGTSIYSSTSEEDYPFMIYSDYRLLMYFHSYSGLPPNCFSAEILAAVLLLERFLFSLHLRTPSPLRRLAITFAKFHLWGLVETIQWTIFKI